MSDTEGSELGSPAKKQTAKYNIGNQSSGSRSSHGSADEYFNASR